jgi:hypothetical protein
MAVLYGISGFPVPISCKWPRPASLARCAWHILADHATLPPMQGKGVS